MALQVGGSALTEQDKQDIRDGIGLGNSATRAVGTTAGTVAAGDDERFSAARTPTAHAATHAEGGDDPITPASIGAAAQVHGHTAGDVSGLAAVATSGAYGDLTGRPTLGTAAATDASAYATAAQGTDAREWTAATVEQAEAEAGTATTRRAWTALRVRQAIAAWWTATASTLIKTVNGSSLIGSGDVTVAGAYEVADWAALLALTGVPDGRVYTVLAPVVTGGTRGTQWAADSGSPSGWRPRGRQVLHVTTDVLDGTVDTTEQVLYAPEVLGAVLAGCRVVDLFGRFGHSGSDSATRSARARINSSAAVSGSAVLHGIGGGVAANARFVQIAVTFYPVSPTAVRLTAPAAAAPQGSPRSVTSSTTAIAADITVSSLSSVVYPMLTIQSGASPTTFATRTVASLTVE